MSTAGWIALSIAAVVFMVIEFLKAKYIQKPPSYVPVGYHSPAKLFFGWLVVLGVFNVMGFLFYYGTRAVAAQNANAFWCVGLFFAWLAVTAAIMPFVLPKDYRLRMESGQITLGSGLLAGCLVGWSLVAIVPILPWLLDVG